MKKEQIARVVGYASQRPKTPEDPLNHANRRITISMRFTEQASEALKGTQTNETRPKKISLGKEEQAPARTPAPAEPKRQTIAEKAEESAAERQDREDEQERKGEAAEPETGLKVEVGTTLPEGTPLPSSEQAGPLPPRVEKDKIFSGQHSFFD